MGGNILVQLFKSLVKQKQQNDTRNKHLFSDPLADQ